MLLVKGITTTRQIIHPFKGLSGATLLQARRDDEHSYTEIVDVMRAKCENFVNDARQLWRRLVFNFLITNVDDLLQNIGFLYSGNNQWRLAPAFDLNPFPDKSPESKTWLSEDTGPITSINQLIEQAERFALSPTPAQAIIDEVGAAVRRWKEVAVSQEVGMQAQEIIPHQFKNDYIDVSFLYWPTKADHSLGSWYQSQLSVFNKP